MPSWNELLADFIAQVDDDKRRQWIDGERRAAFDRISTLRGDRNVLLYASSFLQKPGSAPQLVSITHEDINGFMSVIFGMDWSKGLTLMLHTPGGNPNAAETIVSYLRSKFSEVEVIVPTLAMSAGTMISLAADEIVMGRQSQLGPIDSQLTVAGRSMSARGVVEQFRRAESEILANPAAAHVWAPITQSMGPALLQDAQNALDYSESMVAGWLAKWMFADDPDPSADPVARGKAVARHFNDASTHKSHGRRIDRDEARAQGLNITDLEADQDLQDAVLTSYHLMTIVFEHSPTTKMITGSNDRSWLKNMPLPPADPGAAAVPIARPPSPPAGPRRQNPNARKDRRKR